MLDKKWQDAVLGSAALPDPTDATEMANINSVVTAFLRNEARLPRAEVAEYVNRALQNEAGELLGDYRVGCEQMDTWESYMLDRAQPDDNEIIEAARAQRETVRAAYDTGREVLGDTVASLRESRAVALEDETCRWLVELDADGYLSEHMALDVPTVFAVHDARPASAGPQGTRPTPAGVGALAASYDPRAATAARSARATSVALNPSTATSLRRAATRADLSRSGSQSAVSEAQATVGALQRGARTASRAAESTREPVQVAQPIFEVVTELARARGARASASTKSTMKRSASHDAEPQM